MTDASSVYPLDKFGGLNLVDDPAEVGWNGALDALNIDLSDSTTMRVRSGSSAAFTPAASGRGILTPGTGGVVAGGFSDNVFRVYTLAGALLKSQANVDDICPIVAYGTGSARKIIAASSSDTAGLVVYDIDTDTISTTGATFARTLAVTPWDNRLVRGGTTNTTTSRVHFSDPGAPTTFGANNYVDLDPNDGESILALARWGNNLFVFKWTKFYVFYGTSTDNSGNPIFNYRTIDTGIGCGFPLATASGSDGLYFASGDGVYITSGGAPRKVSGALDPLFSRTTSSEAAFYAGPTFSGGAGPGNFTRSVYMAFVKDRLYLSFSSGADGTLVYWPARGSWSMYSIRAYGLSSNAENETVTFMAGDATAVRTMEAWNPLTTTDAGSVAITSRYRTGFMAPAQDYSQAVLRETILDGTGSPTLKVATDWGSLDTGAAVTLGTSPAIAEGRDRNSRRGRRFSLQFGGATAWKLHRATCLFETGRIPGQK